MSNDTTPQAQAEAKKPREHLTEALCVIVMRLDEINRRMARLEEQRTA